MSIHLFCVRQGVRFHSVHVEVRDEPSRESLFSLPPADPRAGTQVTGLVAGVFTSLSHVALLNSALFLIHQDFMIEMTFGDFFLNRRTKPIFD